MPHIPALPLGLKPLILGVCSSCGILPPDHLTESESALSLIWTRFVHTVLMDENFGMLRLVPAKHAEIVRETDYVFFNPEIDAHTVLNPALSAAEFSKDRANMQAAWAYNACFLAALTRIAPGEGTGRAFIATAIMALTAESHVSRSSALDFFGKTLLGLLAR